MAGPRGLARRSAVPQPEAKRANSGSARRACARFVMRRVFTIASGYRIEKHAAFLFAGAPAHSPVHAPHAFPRRARQRRNYTCLRNLSPTALRSHRAGARSARFHRCLLGCPGLCRRLPGRPGRRPAPCTSGETMPVGVTDEVLSAIDLSSKGDAWKGNMLRLRKLVVQPGGVVPWHEHKVRPANILIVEGSITEYRSNCKVPIEHKAGDVTPSSASSPIGGRTTARCRPCSIRPTSCRRRCRRAHDVSRASPRPIRSIATDVPGRPPGTSCHSETSHDQR